MNKNKKLVLAIVLLLFLAGIQFFFPGEFSETEIGFIEYDVDYEESSYRFLEVDGGDTNPYREPLVKVNIGFGDRDYFAYTNEHGQLVRVVADRIVLQDDYREPVNASGRYYSDMARVPGTEDPNFDRGHVIADSLGGVANAYNITPQDSVLNRHGNQAYNEQIIRDYGGCENFEVLISYPNSQTQVPYSYKFSFTVMGEEIVDEFLNVSPDELGTERNFIEIMIDDLIDWIKKEFGFNLPPVLWN